MKRAGPISQLEQAELALSYLLRYGVLLCGAVIGVGLFLSFFKMLPVPLASLLNGGRIIGQEVPQSVAEFGAGLGAWDSSAVIALGLLLLIALPVVRVGFTVVLFLIERDYLYFAITLLVFSVLVSGIIFGKAL